MAIGINPLEGYLQSDTDTSNATTQYYGFLNTSGAWYILQTVNSANVMTFRYVAGGGGLTTYSSSWSNRSTLSYDYYPNVIKN